jgi:hypothetical protein
MLLAFTRVPSARRLSFESPVLGSNASLRKLKIREVPVADGAPVFTDDLAPIEEMTRRMLAER